MKYLLNGDELHEIISRMGETVDRDEILALFERNNLNYMKYKPFDFAKVLVDGIPNQQGLEELSDYLYIYTKYHIEGDL